MGVAVRRREEGRVRTGRVGGWDRRDGWPLMRMAEAEGKRE